MTWRKLWRRLVKEQARLRSRPCATLLALLGCDTAVVEPVQPLRALVNDAGVFPAYVMTCWDEDRTYLFDCDHPDGVRIYVEIE